MRTLLLLVCLWASMSMGESADAGSPKAMDSEAVKELYFRAYQIRDSDPELARDLFKQVVQRSPAKNEWHKKAQVRLQELRKVH